MIVSPLMWCRTLLVCLLISVPVVWPCESHGEWGQTIQNEFFGSEACLFTTAVTEAQLFSTSNFTVTAVWANGTGIVGARFQSRLLGDTILTVNVLESTTVPGVYGFSFTPRDPGQHLLQIRLSWFAHRHENEEHGPSHPYTHHDLDYVDRIVYNQSIVLLAHPAIPSETFQLRKPDPCRAGTEDGRWVKMDPATGVCPPWACHYDVHDDPRKVADNVNWLSDKFGFNRGYVWSPWNCSYRIMSADDVKLCIDRKRLSFVGMVGDSLLRESLQNLFSLVVPEYTHSRLKGVETTFHLPLNVSNESSTLAVSYSYNHPMPGCKHVDMTQRERGVVLWNWPMIKTINSGWFMNGMKAKLLGRIKSQFNDIMCGGAPLPSVYVLHPRVQRLDLRFRQGSNPFHKVSPMREDAIMMNISNQVRALGEGVEILDATIISESRWEASWDGIHYGLSVHKSDFQIFEPGKTDLNSTCSRGGSNSRFVGGNDVCDLQQYINYNFCINGRMHWCNNVVHRSNPFDSFEGGVSRMTTMIWLNMLCNNY